jgi:hypothetical protein
VLRDEGEVNVWDEEEARSYRAVCLGFPNESLLEQGYSPLAVRNMLKDVGAVRRWMQERDLQPDQLTPAVIVDFRVD